jgi:ankyrin repeat protein
MPLVNDVPTVLCDNSKNDDLIYKTPDSNSSNNSNSNSMYRGSPDSSGSGSGYITADENDDMNHSSNNDDDKNNNNNDSSSSGQSINTNLTTNNITNSNNNNDSNNNTNNNNNSNSNSIKSLKGLIEAVNDEDINTMKDLLALLPKLTKSVDELGRTALHNACIKGSYQMVELLLQYNANYDAIDIMGKTCLHITDNPKIVYLLCEEGANVNIIDHQGFTPLHVYVLNNNQDCVKQIMLHNGIASIPGPYNLKNALHIAADNSSYDIISILVNCSKHRLMLDMPDINGNTCLHLLTASEVPNGGQLKSILFLLDQGVSVTSTNKLGITALHYVCANSRYLSDNLAEPVVELLLHFKANPNAQDNDGCTPLIIACAHREWNICRLLIEAGADMNVPCPMDSYMLQYGEQNGKKISSKMGIFQDCTTTDLMPRGVRSSLFSCINSYQTPIPTVSRDRCMNCAALFQDDILSMFKFSTGKHHCRYCNRLICQECSPKYISRELMPSFITDSNPEINMRVCLVCYDILKVN